jgi:large subunit ribosomal protein L24
MRLKKGDMVIVITGKSKGKTAKVIEVDYEKERVLLQGVNRVKRHQRPTQTQRQGGIIEKEAPLHISNVMLYDEKSGKGTRIGYKVQSDGKKERISRRSGEVIVAAK